MRRVVRAVVVMMLPIVVAACGTTSGRTGPAGDRDVLTPEEIVSASQSDTFALIQALRPQWLRVRGSGSINSSAGAVQVYLDGSHMGGVSYLRQISTQSVGRIEYMDGLEATQRWGLDHGSGAIVVISRGR